jgi:rhodanese-related sulfurtransferase
VIPEISPTEAHSRLLSAQPPRLIDVREPDEWELTHIAGAELLPLSQWPAVALEKLTDPTQSIVIHCHHGGRSMRAAEFLAAHGFTDVANLTGGIDAWSSEVDPAVPRY